MLGVALCERVHVEYLLQKRLRHVPPQPYHHSLAVLEEIGALGLEALRGERHRRRHRDLAVAVGVTGGRGHGVEGEHPRIHKRRRLGGREREEALPQVGALVRLDDRSVEGEGLVLEQAERVERQQLQRLRQNQLPGRGVGRAELPVHKQNLDAELDELVALGLEGEDDGLHDGLLRHVVDHRIQVRRAEDRADVVGHEHRDGVHSDPPRPVARRVEDGALDGSRRAVGLHVALELEARGERLVGVDGGEFDVALQRLVEGPVVLLDCEARAAADAEDCLVSRRSAHHAADVMPQLGSMRVVLELGHVRQLPARRPAHRPHRHQVRVRGGARHKVHRHLGLGALCGEVLEEGAVNGEAFLLSLRPHCLHVVQPRHLAAAKRGGVAEDSQHLPPVLRQRHARRLHSRPHRRLPHLSVGEEVGEGVEQLLEERSLLR
mmetsp:Transcript_54610/g.111467  ORF Transcript_54610/g.111467 Transcript_54610/m.111467 type:complete len:435 (+) Transcript_54610:312-1616(+)